MFFSSTPPAHRPVVESLSRFDWLDFQGAKLKSSGQGWDLELQGCRHLPGGEDRAPSLQRFAEHLNAAFQTYHTLFKSHLPLLQCLVTQQGLRVERKDGKALDFEKLEEILATAGRTQGARGEMLKDFVPRIFKVAVTDVRHFYGLGYGSGVYQLELPKPETERSEAWIGWLKDTVRQRTGEDPEKHVRKQKHPAHPKRNMLEVTDWVLEKALGAESIKETVGLNRSWVATIERRKQPHQVV